MEKKDRLKGLSTRCEEIQEIMGRPPWLDASMGHFGHLPDCLRIANRLLLHSLAPNIANKGLCKNRYPIRFDLCKK